MKRLTHTRMKRYFDIALALSLMAHADGIESMHRKVPVLLEKSDKPNKRLLRELEQKHMGKKKKRKKLN